MRDNLYSLSKLKLRGGKFKDHHSQVSYARSLLYEINWDKEHFANLSSIEAIEIVVTRKCI